MYAFYSYLISIKTITFFVVLFQAKKVYSQTNSTVFYSKSQLFPAKLYQSNYECIILATKILFYNVLDVSMITLHLQ